MNSRLMTIGAIGVSVITTLGFIGALVISYLSKDASNLSMLLGIVAGGFQAVLGFWLGSSAGSQKKDEVIAQKLPNP